MEAEKNKKHIAMQFTRRMFLQLGLWVSGLASAWGIFKFLSYEAPGEKFLPSITLDQPIVYSQGSITFVPEVKAWLIHDEDGIYALSATCTHLGCMINDEQDKFVCPCHGSQFDFSGRVLQGPATISLQNFEVKLSDDGRVIIDRRVTVLPTQRLEL
jgi:nitrite reductase/ring-hydroxylating ferredoxin subunit